MTNSLARLGNFFRGILGLGRTTGKHYPYLGRALSDSTSSDPRDDESFDPSTLNRAQRRALESRARRIGMAPKSWYTKKHSPGVLRTFKSWWANYRLLMKERKKVA